MQHREPNGPHYTTTTTTTPTIHLKPRLASPSTSHTYLLSPSPSYLADQTYFLPFFTIPVLNSCSPSLPPSLSAFSCCIIIIIIMQENQKQREVMWPKLVANKLFRAPSESHRFVADFPSSGDSSSSSMEGTTSTEKQSSRAEKYTQKFKLFASTWNVGGVQPSSDLKLDDWLDTANSYDIYVLGFQEIVPLSTKNILGHEKSRVSVEWNSIIRTTLNKTLVSESPEHNKLGENQKVHPFKRCGTAAIKDYVCVVSKHMVGISVSVWIRSSLVQHVRHTSVSCIGCGIMGCLGNKGSVTVRFLLHETSFCFVCCHLASGGKEGDEARRNSDAVEIFARTSFPRGPAHNLPQKILDHDRIILLGDLNYRISLPEDTTRTLVEQEQWDVLLEKDQLLAEFLEDGTFRSWREGTIRFSPTYKYYPNSDVYYGCVQGVKGEKRRAPAWCDRIIWNGKGLTQTRYDRCETVLSDHRPVVAVFTAEVEAAAAAARELGSLGRILSCSSTERTV